MRYMGLDYGNTTVGVAASDALGLMVMPVETITREKPAKLRRTCARIEELVKELGIDAIVVGNPLNMDGSAGERSRLASEFAQTVGRRTGLPVHMSDERLTTVEADWILSETNVPKSERKRYIDQMAAVLILEGWMREKGLLSS